MPIPEISNQRAELVHTFGQRSLGGTERGPGVTTDGIGRTDGRTEGRRHTASRSTIRYPKSRRLSSSDALKQHVAAASVTMRSAIPDERGGRANRIGLDKSRTFFSVISSRIRVRPSSASIDWRHQAPDVPRAARTEPTGAPPLPGGRPPRDLRSLRVTNLETTVTVTSRR